MSRRRSRRDRRPGPRVRPPARAAPRTPPVDAKPAGRRLGARAWVARRRVPIAAAGGLVMVLVAALAAWQNSQPPKPDDQALRSAIASGRTGAEVTFAGTVVSAPAGAGGHERFDVRDGLGDQVELDYNIQLGEWIPVRVGDRVTVHGRLYVDPGRAGVHCLHAQTSSGCPSPGWIALGGKTYS